ncbi:hypothetical protein ACFYYB_33555 [Streptomyces sp. NPDC002886]|uniref:hypothetical protein n=1 Tax=Streptomyces sp. NPDC002886 TaxID=3364667 RepID=UPI0036A7A1A5
MSDSIPGTGQQARQKAVLIADQVLEAATGARAEISNGVPTSTAVLARPAVRYGLLLALATLAVCGWRSRRHH